MTDSKYFTTTKKGEIFELKSELQNEKKEKKKEAVKKVCQVTFLERININFLLKEVIEKLQRLVFWLHISGHRKHDSRQRCVGALSRCCQLYAN